MGDLPTGAGDHEDTERGLSRGGGGGTDVDCGPACPYCGFKGEHLSGYGFAAGSLGAYTYCGNEDACGKLIEFGPDLEGLDDETAASITAKVDAWRASLPVSESGE
jgi:hypothetical protein